MTFDGAPNNKTTNYVRSFVLFITSMIVAGGIAHIAVKQQQPQSKETALQDPVPSTSQPMLIGGPPPTTAAIVAKPPNSNKNNNNNNNNRMEVLKCAVEETWSCGGAPLNPKCGLLLGYDKRDDIKMLVLQVKEIRMTPLFDSNRLPISLVTNMDPTDERVASNDLPRLFKTVVHDAELPSAREAYEIIQRTPYERTMFFNRSARAWQRTVAPMHYALDLLRYHDVLMTAEPHWDRGEHVHHEATYQTGVIFARSPKLSECVGDFLSTWREKNKAALSAGTEPRWVGAEDMVGLPEAVRRSYIRLMPLPPEFCLNDVVGKDECVDWKRRYKGTNARCDVYGDINSVK
eukprot:PhM_4_TR17347/c0_g1_i1/m.41765